MKPFFPAVIALVVGIVLGAWQPRGELLTMRSELDALKEAGGKPCRSGAADSIRSILRADPSTFESAGAERTVRNVEGADPVEGTDDQPPTGGENAAPVDGAPPETPEQLRAAMNTALDARRGQALAALVEQGGLEDAEVAAVTDAMDQMNRELKTEVDAFVQSAVASGEVDRRDVMDFAAEALDIVIAADDRLQKAVPADVYAEVDEAAVDPFSYLSGDALESLVRLEGVAGPGGQPWLGE
ncbi:MAG: hypothetical protein Q8P18_27450 [Pseudomonadota bacterium]|nr:hypothetical protein [Pseudomonadota bacterium]